MPSANGQRAVGDSSIAFRLSSLTGSGKPGRVTIHSALVAKFHRSGGYGPGEEAFLEDQRRWEPHSLDRLQASPDPALF
jgi:hypothetical protein